MKVGLLLGTFDPPHIGHLYLATQALETKKVDFVWMLPAWSSPWKPDATKFDIRYEMCLDLVGPEYIEYNILPLNLEKATESSHTHEFLKYLLDTFPNFDFAIITGSDIDIKLWKNGAWILENFEQIVVPRFELPCSSTQIRELIKVGKNPLPLITPKVYNIIKRNHLYGS